MFVCVVFNTSFYSTSVMSWHFLGNSPELLVSLSAHQFISYETIYCRKPEYKSFLACLFFEEKMSWYYDILGVVVCVCGFITKLKPYLITQKAFNIFEWNFVHIFLGTICMCLPSHITEALTFIQ